MALVKRISKNVAEEKEKLALGDLVPSYEWQTSTGASREGLKLHYLSFLPERAEGDKSQPAQFSGFCDGFTDPLTGTVRGGRECVPLRLTGAAGVALAARVLAAVAMAEGRDAAEAMAGFDPSAPFTVKTGSLYLDLRDGAEAEALRGDDRELVALYATNGSLSGRVMYAPPFEFEEGFE